MTLRAGRDGVSPDSPLHRLAARHGVDISYVDSLGRGHTATDETLVGILRALGEPITSPGDAAGILAGEAGQAAAGSPAIPAVVVAWDGQLPPVVIGPEDAHRAVTVELALEDGGDPHGLVHVEARGGSTVVVAPAPLPFGLHDLAVSLPSGARSTGSRAGAPDHGEPDEITVISAPRSVRPIGPRAWGVFAPAYALHDDRSGDLGDLTCLERLGHLAAAAGASYVATLPILADFSRADDPDGTTSPYSPLSRMWWHEGYLDVSRVPEIARPSDARCHARGRIRARPRPSCGNPQARARNGCKPTARARWSAPHRVRGLRREPARRRLLRPVPRRVRAGRPAVADVAGCLAARPDRRALS